MKTSILLYPCLLFLMAVTAACEDEPQPATVKPVIEGWIDSGGYPRVIFTSSFVVGDGTDGETIADKIIRWGKVTISDGDKTVVMTGGPDNDLFPPYSYYTYYMEGVPGKTYTITADYEGFHAEASARMPSPPEVIDLRTERIAGSDTLRSASVVIAAPDDCPAYYHISTRVIPDDTRHYPALLGCAAAETPGQTIEIPIYRGKTSLSDSDFVAQLPTNRAVSIKIERVTREVYDFWKSFNEATLFGGSLFVNCSTSLPSNISGGLGYWSPQGVTMLTLPAEDNL